MQTWPKGSIVWATWRMPRLVPVITLNQAVGRGRRGRTPGGVVLVENGVVRNVVPVSALDRHTVFVREPQFICAQEKLVIVRQR